MFFLEQGALDYITRLEAQGKPEALTTRSDLEAADGHDHTHLNLLDAAQAAHAHTHLCAGGKDTALAKGSEALQTLSRQLALCLSLELSIVVHSVIIGCACSAPVAVQM